MATKSKTEIKIPLPYELGKFKEAHKKLEKKLKIKIPLPYDLKKFYGHTDNSNLIIKKK